MKILKFLLPLILLVSLSSCSYVVEVKDKLFDKNDKKGELASSPEDEARLSEINIKNLYIESIVAEVLSFFGIS